MNKKSIIWVTFRKEGIHKYPAALDDPKLATGDEFDVSFLGYPHRHIFHFKVGIEVFHNDRDIEFIQFKRWLEKLYAEKTLQLDFKSCEMMSDDLYGEIQKKYPGKTANWYKAKGREIRKQKTIDFCKELGVVVESDNVADACGIGWYAANNMVR